MDYRHRWQESQGVGGYWKGEAVAVGVELLGNLCILFACVAIDYLKLIDLNKDKMKVLLLLATVAQGDIAQR